MTIRRKKTAGKAPSYITSAIESHLEDAELERLWADFIRDVNPGVKDVQRATAIFKRLKSA